MKWFMKVFAYYKASDRSLERSSETQRDVLKFLNDNELKPENVMVIPRDDNYKIVLFYYADRELGNQKPPIK